MIGLITFVLGVLLGGGVMALTTGREIYCLVKENRRLKGRIKHLIDVIRNQKTNL